MADVVVNPARMAAKTRANERSADGRRGQGASNAEDPGTPGSCLPVHRSRDGMITNNAWRSQARRQRLSSKDRERGARRRRELTACRKWAEP